MSNYAGINADKVKYSDGIHFYNRNISESDLRIIKHMYNSSNEMVFGVILYDTDPDRFLDSWYCNIPIIKDIAMILHWVSIARYICTVNIPNGFDEIVNVWKLGPAGSEYVVCTNQTGERILNVTPFE